MTGNQKIMERTVLVIEDDHLNMKLMRSLLGLGGYRMVEAGDAETGLRLAVEHKPDLILMDVQLPGLDGLSATRRLKENPELAAIPVIALTGLAMEGDREKALDAGCQDYISKPINTRSFLGSLGALLVPEETYRRTRTGTGAFRIISPTLQSRPGGG